MPGSILTPRYGVNITATIHEPSSAMQSTQKRFRTYSPGVDCANPIGINPITVTSVPANIGAAVWLHA